jgi:spermidine synthase
MFLEETVDESFGLKAFFEGEMVYQEDTPYQKITVFDSKAFGRLLMLDGAMQLTQKDEMIYHNSMVSNIMSRTMSKSILIVGGGDGGILREVLKYKIVENVDLVELDERVIEVSKELLPFVSDGAFNDSRVKVHIQDALIFVKETKNKYDVIIIDSPDPTEDTMDLFAKEFYMNCEKILNYNGRIICQIHSLSESTAMNTKRVFHSIFLDSGSFDVSVPSFPFGNIIMVWGMK